MTQLLKSPPQGSSASSSSFFPVSKHSARNVNNSSVEVNAVRGRYRLPQRNRKIRALQNSFYHSGHNRDYQRITAAEPTHELLRNSESDSGVIEYLPAHPHEGGIGVPPDVQQARVIATGISQVTHRPFNLIVAFESRIDPHGNKLGRAIAVSSFHQFADYTWDTSRGCPSFVTEGPGDEIRRDPAKLRDVKVYVRNVPRWLARG